MTLAIVDVQRILALSVAGGIAREIAGETKETAGRVTQAQREDLLLALVLQDVAALIPVAAQAKGCTLVLERQRAGVLYSNPATAVDLTAAVLAAYDTWFNGLLTQQGREVVLQGIRDRLDGILKAQPSEDTKGTGHYL
jgi:hypothetical protein